MDCYCQERKTNPQLVESLKDLPEGYCGVCDVCGKPGHMRAHPSLPTTGAWCDEHWAAMNQWTSFITLDRIFGTAVIVFSSLLIAYMTWRMFW